MADVYTFDETNKYILIDMYTHTHRSRQSKDRWFVLCAFRHVHCTSQGGGASYCHLALGGGHTEVVGEGLARRVRGGEKGRHSFEVTTS